MIKIVGNCENNETRNFFEEVKNFKQQQTVIPNM